MRTSHAEPVMGTGVAIEVRHRPADLARPALHRAFAWLHWVDAVFSPFRADSQISRLDRGAIDLGDCHPEVADVLAQCERLRVATGGFFDARACGRLDPSGLVKGWSLERASDLLVAGDCPDHVINGGGDVRVRGRAGPGTDWQVGVTHPMRLDAYCAALHLDGGAVATSGTYERGFHVIDPHRGRPVTALAAVTVIGPELAMTDAYATAALAMGVDAPAWLASLPEHEALVIDSAGHGWETAGFGRYRLEVGRT
jgi:thiamine biosynthesis lipoprotein